MYTLEQKLKIVQLWYETKSPAEVRRRFNTHQGYKSKSKCAALTNLKIQRIVQHFEKEKTLHHVHKGRSGRRTSAGDFVSYQSWTIFNFCSSV